MRWLSRGKVKNMVFELKDKLHRYFQETKKQDFTKSFDDEQHLPSLICLEDIFRHMNELNK